MAEHSAPDHKHRPAANSAAPLHSRAGAGGGLSGGLSQPAGWQSLLSFTILFLAWLAGFSSRLFAVIRFESIIHEFDPWSVAAAGGRDGEAGKSRAMSRGGGEPRVPSAGAAGTREGPAARPPLRRSAKLRPCPFPGGSRQPRPPREPRREARGEREREGERRRCGRDTLWRVAGSVRGQHRGAGEGKRREERRCRAAGCPCGRDLGTGRRRLPRIPWSCGRTLRGARGKLWRWQGIGSR